MMINRVEVGPVNTGAGAECSAPRHHGGGSGGQTPTSTTILVPYRPVETTDREANNESSTSAPRFHTPASTSVSISEGPSMLGVAAPDIETGHGSDHSNGYGGGNGGRLSPDKRDEMRHEAAPSNSSGKNYVNNNHNHNNKNKNNNSNGGGGGEEVGDPRVGERMHSGRRQGRPSRVEEESS